MNFKTFELTHIFFLIFFGIMLLALIRKKDFFIKHDILVRVFLLVSSVTLEANFVVGKINAGEWWAPLPHGLCQIGLYLTMLLLIKYNRHLHLLTILFTSGAALSFLVSFDIDGISMFTFRPYHFMLVHYNIVFANIYLGLKKNLYIKPRDFTIAFCEILLILTFLFVLNSITGINTVYLISGPEGTFFDKIPPGLLRTIVCYAVFALLFCIPYFIHCISRKKQNNL